MGRVTLRELGERIMLARRRRNWPHKVLATAAGMSEARLYRIECGDVWPEQPELVAICRALGVDEEPIRREGEQWYRRLRAMGPLSGPHVFDIPDQFDPALTIDGTVVPSPGVRDHERAAGRLPPPSAAPALCAWYAASGRRTRHGISVWPAAVEEADGPW